MAAAALSSIIILCITASVTSRLVHQQIDIDLLEQKGCQFLTRFIVSQVSFLLQANVGPHIWSDPRGLDLEMIAIKGSNYKLLKPIFDQPNGKLVSETLINQFALFRQPMVITEEKNKRVVIEQIEYLGSVYHEEYMFYLCLAREHNNLVGERWGSNKQLRVALHLRDGATKSELSNEHLDVFRFSCVYFPISLIFVVVLFRKIYSYYSHNFDVQLPLMIMLLTSALICVEHMTPVFVFGLEATTGIYSPHLLLLAQLFQIVSITSVTVFFIRSISFCLYESRIGIEQYVNKTGILSAICVWRAVTMLSGLLWSPPEEQYFNTLAANNLGASELLACWAFLGGFLYLSSPKDGWSKDSVKKVKFVQRIKKACIVQFGMLPTLSVLIQLLFPVISHSFSRIILGGGTLIITIWMGMISSHKEGVFLSYQLSQERGEVNIIELGDLRKD